MSEIYNLSKLSLWQRWTSQISILISSEPVTRMNWLGFRLPCNPPLLSKFVSKLCVWALIQDLVLSLRSILTRKGIIHTCSRSERAEFSVLIFKEMSYVLQLNSRSAGLWPWQCQWGNQGCYESNVLERSRNELLAAQKVQQADEQNSFEEVAVSQRSIHEWRIQRTWSFLRREWNQNQVWHWSIIQTRNLKNSRSQSSFTLNSMIKKLSISTSFFLLWHVRISSNKDKN
jgi:hypothetical protein